MNEFGFEKASKTPWKIHASVLLLHIFAIIGITTASLCYQQITPKKIVVQTISLQKTLPPAPVYIASEESPIAHQQNEEAEEVIEETPAPTVEEAPKEEYIAKEEPAQPEPITEEPPPPQPSPKPQPKPQPKVQPEAKPKPKPKPQPKPKVKQTPKPKQTPKKQQAKPKAQAKPQKKQATTPAKKTTPQIDTRALEQKRSLIDEALKSLDRATEVKSSVQGSSSSSFSSKAPSKISTLASDSLVAIASEGETFTGRERSYYDELVSRLQLTLKLPEYGDVKLKLTLSRQGQVTKVTVMSSKSKKNKDYIEKMIPKISFPKFGDNFGSENAHTFLLRLRNDLNY
jgi:outer membrane biosynthesis protein TonB